MHAPLPRRAWADPHSAHVTSGRSSGDLVSAGEAWMAQNRAPGEAPAPVLRRLLFQEPAHDRSTLGIVWWWEAHRLLFNLLVGGAGLVTLVVLGVLILVVPRAPFFIDWQIVLLYGVVANALYTAGWMVELWLRRFLGADHPVIGPVLFRYGLVFSLALTLMPLGLAVLLILNRLLGRPIAGW